MIEAATNRDLENFLDRAERFWKDNSAKSGERSKGEALHTISPLGQNALTKVPDLTQMRRSGNEVVRFMEQMIGSSLKFIKPLQ